MVLRIDPSLPVLWRSPSSLQLGVAGRVVMEEVSPAAERIVAALAIGTSETGIRMIARGAGMPPAELDALLARLGPALEQRPAPLPGVAVTGRGPVAEEVARQLEDAGVRTGLRQGPDIVILVADHVVAPEDHGRWLRRDVAHLPLVVGAERVEAGPLVVPGDGPCLHCAQLARTEADPAWPAMAAQLLRLAPVEPGRTVQVEAAALAVRRVLGAGAPPQGGDGLLQRLRVSDGTVSALRIAPHPECLCRGLPGSGWAPAAGPAAPVAPSAAPAAAVPA